MQIDFTLFHLEHLLFNSEIFFQFVQSLKCIKAKASNVSKFWQHIPSIIIAKEQTQSQVFSSLIIHFLFSRRTNKKRGKKTQESEVDKS